MAASTDDKLRNRYRSELKWIRRGAKARSTKQKARIGRFEELAEKVKKEDTGGEMDVALKSTRLGKKVIEAIGISKSFGGRKIIDDFSCLLQSGDRIAVVGPNGAGKTTLLNLFSGEIEPDSGIIEKGSTVKIAHFHQHMPMMDENKRIIEYIRETSMILKMLMEYEFLLHKCWNDFYSRHKHMEHRSVNYQVAKAKDFIY